MNGLSDQRIKCPPLWKILILLLCSAGLASSQKAPCSKNEIENGWLARHVASPIILKAIRERGVDFFLTDAVESELRKKGATQEIIDAIKQHGPAPPPQPPPEPPSPVIVYSDIEVDEKFSGKAWCVTGANTPDCGTPLATRWIAAPFDAGRTIALSSIALALGYNSGQNSVDIILLNSAADGRPGAVLESWRVLNLPANSSAPLAATIVTSKGTLLQAGESYWLEVRAAADDTMVSWFPNTRGLGGGIWNSNDSGWNPLKHDSFGEQTRPAFAVSGLPQP